MHFVHLFFDLIMALRLPPLIALRAFEAFGRSGSVKAAADELAVSPTVVSRHIRNLEATLAAQLTRKSGRNLALTDQGSLYLAEISGAFDRIGAATRGIRGKASMAPLHLACMPGLAAGLLLSRLSELQQLVEGRGVMLRPVTDRPDFEREGIDAEIVYLAHPLPGQAAGLRAEMFCRPRIVPAASIAFRERYPAVRTPADLVSLPLISEQTTDYWLSWFRAAGVTDLPPLHGPRLWHRYQTIEAARLDQGVVLLSELLLSGGHGAERLIEMVPSAIRIGAYYFVARARDWDDPTIATIRDWVSGVCNDELNRHSTAAR
jgi:LysR family glycine cleavage system transcriptional activator